MAVKAKKPRFKTLAGAERRVRRLEKVLHEYGEMCCRKDAEKQLLAKLAATGPAFFNPLEAAAAEMLRDEILRRMNMRSDGTFIT